VQISLHYILSFTHETYGRVTSLSNIASHLRGGTAGDKYPVPEEYYSPSGYPNSSQTIDRHANASFVILARNSDVDGTVRSIREIEDRFNRKYRYPYVFLNEEPFSDEFKR